MQQQPNVGILRSSLSHPVARESSEASTPAGIAFAVLMQQGYWSNPLPARAYCDRTIKRNWRLRVRSGIGEMLDARCLTPVVPQPQRNPDRPGMGRVEVSLISSFMQEAHRNLEKTASALPNGGWLPSIIGRRTGKYEKIGTTSTSRGLWVSSEPSGPANPTIPTRDVVEFTHVLDRAQVGQVPTACPVPSTSICKTSGLDSANPRYIENAPSEGSDGLWDSMG
ncbi:hypothetical protein PG997_011220 [Apiospora hydei]|uniref:Uncharacterized protein n=1 Tax=Apiospora hydei TaxID=1337664 RepID=A0ABR1VJF3_9PEZI